LEGAGHSTGMEVEGAECAREAEGVGVVNET